MTAIGWQLHGGKEVNQLLLLSERCSCRALKTKAPYSANSTRAAQPQRQGALRLRHMGNDRAALLSYVTLSKVLTQFASRSGLKLLGSKMVSGKLVLLSFTATAATASAAALKWFSNALRHAADALDPSQISPGLSQQLVTIAPPRHSWAPANLVTPLLGACVGVSWAVHRRRRNASLHSCSLGSLRDPPTCKWKSPKVL